MRTRKKSISNKELLASLRKDREYRAAEKNLEAKTVLARNILRYRADRDLTQRQLAEKAGMKQPRIAGLESMRGNPSLDTLEKIALALDVSASDLLSPPQPQITYKGATQSPKVEVDLIGLFKVTAGLEFGGNAEASPVEGPMPFIQSLYASHRLKLTN